MNEITTLPRASALSLMADRCNVDPAKLHLTLKNTVFKGSTDDELLALVVTSNIYQLNPFLKEIYAFPKKGGGIVPLVGFDGWIKIANRQPNFDGMDVDVHGDGKNPTHATCKIYLKDRSRPVEITEYFSECHRNTDPWNQMPRRMMRNKAIIQGIRVAFGVAGIHDEDEGEDIAMRDVTPRQAPAKALPSTERAPFPTEWTEAPAPAQEPEKPSAETYQETVEYVSGKIVNSPEGAKPAWQMVEINYVAPSGKPESARSFSKTLAAKVGRIEDGEFIPQFEAGQFLSLTVKTDEHAKHGKIFTAIAMEGGES